LLFFALPTGLDVIGFKNGVDDVRGLVALHGWTGTDQVLVAVNVVDTTDARPQLGVGPDEWLKLRGIRYRNTIIGAYHGVGLSDGR
jgi:hypothetical protein